MPISFSDLKRFEEEADWAKALKEATSQDISSLLDEITHVSPDEIKFSLFSPVSTVCYEVGMTFIFDKIVKLGENDNSTIPILLDKFKNNIFRPYFLAKTKEVLQDIPLNNTIYLPIFLEVILDELSKKRGDKKSLDELHSLLLEKNSKKTVLGNLLSQINQMSLEVKAKYYSIIWNLILTCAHKRAIEEEKFLLINIFLEEMFIADIPASAKIIQYFFSKEESFKMRLSYDDKKNSIVPILLPILKQLKNSPLQELSSIDSRFYLDDWNTNWQNSLLIRMMNSTGGIAISWKIIHQNETLFLPMLSKTLKNCRLISSGTAKDQEEILLFGFMGFTAYPGEIGHENVFCLI